MGRARPKVHATLTQTPSIPPLVAKAKELIVQCDYELALRFVRRILEHQPGNVEAREMLGVCLLETGDIEAAKEVGDVLSVQGSDTTCSQAFQILVQPPSLQQPPPSAHLYLAQLSDEDPRLALQHYQAAVEILFNQLKGKQPIQTISPSHHLDEPEIKASIVRALIGQVEVWMDPSYDLWCVRFICSGHDRSIEKTSFEPEAEKTCEDLLDLALRTDPDNPEALQSLASVRMSQQRPDEAKQILEQAWMKWKDLQLDDPALPPIPDRLTFVRLFLELELYTPALLVLQGIMAADDQEVEAWYLEGWCLFLMSESAKETGDKLDDMSWDELAKDARDCLEACQVVSLSFLPLLLTQSVL